jgi:hypothetical protein
MAFLDGNGVTTLVARLKNHFALKTDILTIDDIYPVNSVYQTVNPLEQPSQLFGGTWSRVGSQAYVISGSIHGTNNDWNYRKWSDGLLECWARFYIGSMNISSTTGQLKYGSVSLTTEQRTYPIAFKDYPNVTVSGNVSGGNGWVVMNNTDYSETKLGTMTAYSSASRTGVGVTVNVYARGHWLNQGGSYEICWVRTA